MKIISWNVNGINACMKKGLAEFMKTTGADIYCFQEVKAQADKLPTAGFDGYTAYHSFARKKGYSGVSVFTRTKPLKVTEGIGQEEFDAEGRTLTLEFRDFFLINVYFPHAHRELKRLKYKLDFNATFLAFCKELEKKKPVVIASDFNVAHTEIDLRNPKQNEKNAGFTAEERKWFDDFLKAGFVDTFRVFSADGGHYTWWTYRNNARERNIGWRIDYFVVSKRLAESVKKSEIMGDVLGSDHCPILLEIF